MIDLFERLKKYVLRAKTIKYVIIALVAGAFFGNPLTGTIDLKSFAGSYQQLDSKQKYLSPLNGVIYYHRIIRGTWMEKNPLGKFCQQLFHSVDGNGQQFHYTDKPSEVAYHLVPEICGSMIAEIETARMNPTWSRPELETRLMKLFTDNGAFITSTEATQDKNQKILEEAKAIKKQKLDALKQLANTHHKNFITLRKELLNLKTIKGIPGAFHEIKNTHLDAWLHHEDVIKNTDILSQIESLAKNVRDYQSQKDAIEDQFQQSRKIANKLNFQQDTLKDFIAIFIDACCASQLLSLEEEISSTTTTPGVPASTLPSAHTTPITCLPETPYYLLQAFVYRKFTTINELQIFCDHMTHSTIKLNHRTAQGDFEQAVFDLLSNTSIPQFDDYCESQATAPDKTILSFADCMDNTMRHFFHLLAFDHETQSFDISRLQKISAGAINQALLDYFQQFPTPMLANTPAGHKSWAQLISNIPGMGYVQSYDPKTKTISRGSFFHESILPQTTTIEGITYQPQSNDNFLFETEVSLHNLIIASNYMLDLKLFNLDDKTFQQTIFPSSSFVEQFFPDLNNKLGTLFNTEKLFDDTDLHTQTITLAHDLFTISLNRGAHASIQPITKTVLAPLVRANHLYTILIRGTDKREIWDLMTMSLQNRSRVLHGTLADLTRAYYHAIMMHGAAGEDIDQIINIYTNLQPPTVPYCNKLLSWLEQSFQALTISKILHAKNCEDLLGVLYGDDFSTNRRCIEIFQKFVNSANNPIMITAREGTFTFFQTVLGMLATEHSQHNISELLESGNSEAAYRLAARNKISGGAILQHIIDVTRHDQSFQEKIMFHTPITGLTPLMLGMYYDNITYMKTILHCAQEKNCLEKMFTESDYHGENPIVYAAKNHKTDALRTMIDAMHNTPDLLEKMMSQQDDYGYSMLQNAVIYSRLNMVIDILNAVQPYPHILERLLTEPDQYGKSAFQRALSCYETKIIQHILQIIQDNQALLAKVITTINEQGNALHRAINFDNEMATIILKALEHHPEILEIALSQTDHNGNTPLHCTMNFNMEESFKIIFDAIKTHPALIVNMLTTENNMGLSCINLIEAKPLLKNIALQHLEPNNLLIAHLLHNHEQEPHRKIRAFLGEEIMTNAIRRNDEIAVIINTNPDRFPATWISAATRNLTSHKRSRDDHEHTSIDENQLLEDASEAEHLDEPAQRRQRTE